jgi:hypothetical protein
MVDDLVETLKAWVGITCGSDMSSTYIYPSNLNVDGRDIAIAFDEEELESLVKILEEEGGQDGEHSNGKEEEYD